MLEGSILPLTSEGPANKIESFRAICIRANSLCILEMTISSSPVA